MRTFQRASSDMSATSPQGSSSTIRSPTTTSKPSKGSAGTRRGMHGRSTRSDSPFGARAKLRSVPAAKTPGTPRQTSAGNASNANFSKLKHMFESPDNIPTPLQLAREKFGPAVGRKAASKASAGYHPPRSPRPKFDKAASVSAMATATDARTNSPTPANAASTSVGKSPLVAQSRSTETARSSSSRLDADRREGSRKDRVNPSDDTIPTGRSPRVSLRRLQRTKSESSVAKSSHGSMSSLRSGGSSRQRLNGSSTSLLSSPSRRRQSLTSVQNNITRSPGRAPRSSGHKSGRPPASPQIPSRPSSRRKVVASPRIRKDESLKLDKSLVHSINPSEETHKDSSGSTKLTSTASTGLATLSLMDDDDDNSNNCGGGTNDCDDIKNAASPHNDNHGRHTCGELDLQDVVNANSHRGDPHHNNSRASLPLHDETYEYISASEVDSDLTDDDNDDDDNSSSDSSSSDSDSDEEDDDIDDDLGDSGKGQNGVASITNEAAYRADDFAVDFLIEALDEEDGALYADAENDDDNPMDPSRPIQDYRRGRSKHKRASINSVAKKTRPKSKGKHTPRSKSAGRRPKSKGRLADGRKLKKKKKKKKRKLTKAEKRAKYGGLSLTFDRDKNLVGNAMNKSSLHSMAISIASDGSDDSNVRSIEDDAGSAENTAGLKKKARTLRRGRRPALSQACQAHEDEPKEELQQHQGADGQQLDGCRDMSLQDGPKEQRDRARGKSKEKKKEKFREKKERDRSKGTKRSRRRDRDAGDMDDSGEQGEISLVAADGDENDNNGGYDNMGGRERRAPNAKPGRRGRSKDKLQSAKNGNGNQGSSKDRARSKSREKQKEERDRRAPPRSRSAGTLTPFFNKWKTMRAKRDQSGDSVSQTEKNAEESKESETTSVSPSPISILLEKPITVVASSAFSPEHKRRTRSKSVDDKVLLSPSSEAQENTSGRRRGDDEVGSAPKLPLPVDDTVRQENESARAPGLYHVTDETLADWKSDSSASVSIHGSVSSSSNTDLIFEDDDDEDDRGGGRSDDDGSLSVGSGKLSTNGKKKWRDNKRRQVREYQLDIDLSASNARFDVVIRKNDDSDNDEDGKRSDDEGQSNIQNDNKSSFPELSVHYEDQPSTDIPVSSAHACTVSTAGSAASYDFHDSESRCKSSTQGSRNGSPRTKFSNAADAGGLQNPRSNGRPDSFGQLARATSSNGHEDDCETLLHLRIRKLEAKINELQLKTAHEVKYMRKELESRKEHLHRRIQGPQDAVDKLLGLRKEIIEDLTEESKRLEDRRRALDHDNAAEFSVALQLAQNMHALQQNITSVTASIWTTTEALNRTSRREASLQKQLDILTEIHQIHP